jgi:hypothetical protein
MTALPYSVKEKQYIKLYGDMRCPVCGYQRRFVSISIFSNPEEPDDMAVKLQVQCGNRCPMMRRTDGNWSDEDYGKTITFIPAANIDGMADYTQINYIRKNELENREKDFEQKESILAAKLSSIEEEQIQQRQEFEDYMSRVQQEWETQKQEEFAIIRREREQINEEKQELNQIWANRMKTFDEKIEIAEKRLNRMATENSIEWPEQPETDTPSVKKKAKKTTRKRKTSTNKK